MPPTIKQDRHADDDDALDREGEQDRPHVAPGQEIGRREAHHDEEQRDDRQQPELAHATICFRPEDRLLGELLAGPVEGIALMAASPHGSRRNRHVPGKPRGKLHDRLLVHVVALHLAGDPALVQHQDAVADADQLRQLRRDRDDADALVGEVAQDGVDLRLGADVDAARRLVDEEHARVDGKQLGQRHLLLVAAGKLRHRLVHAGAANAEPLAHRFGERRLAAPAHHEAARHALQVERGNVLGDRQVEEDAVALAVLAEIDDPLADRGQVVALPDLRAVAIDRAGAAVRKAADRLHRLGASRADQPAEARRSRRAAPRS